MTKKEEYYRAWLIWTSSNNYVPIDPVNEHV